MDQKVLDLYDARLIKFGKFTLKSGKESPVYIDLRGIVSHPLLLKEIGYKLGDIVCLIGCDRIAGIPYAGLPLATAACINRAIPMIYWRKEIKEYGTQRLIEGDFEPNESVILIDDVATNADSKIEAAKIIESVGLKVKAFLIIVDRCQGADKILASAGYELHSLIKLTEVIEILAATGKIDINKKDEVLTYLSENQF